MAKQYDEIEPQLRKFIEKQHIFFVATAAANSRINLSPKGQNALRVIDARTVAYLDWTGSGSEAAAHLLADGRMTIMVCSFEGPAMILRLYGRARSHLKGSAAYERLLAEQFNGEEPLSARQIVELDVELTQTSCGYAVPEYEYKGEREVLTEYWDKRGAEGVKAYWAEENLTSIDGLPTGFEAMLEGRQDAT
jgi:predicted pyridoxine 5'-phosphate oxidase superfamily flavin-nucleotide-binding protein